MDQLVLDIKSSKPKSQRESSIHHPKNTHQPRNTFQFFGFIILASLFFSCDSKDLILDQTLRFPEERVTFFVTRIRFEGSERVKIYAKKGSESFSKNCDYIFLTIIPRRADGQFTIKKGDVFLKISDQNKLVVSYPTWMNPQQADPVYSGIPIKYVK